MAEQTQIKPDDLRASGDRIGDIMNDEVMSVFNDLDEQPPTAGSFPTATWLHGRVSDRVNAVQQQAQVLKNAFGDICTGLHNVADDLENTDQNNGERIQGDFNTMDRNVGMDTSSIGSVEKA
jgi:hypothetical protein